jgi:hypothetical protein
MKWCVNAIVFYNGGSNEEIRKNAYRVTQDLKKQTHKRTAAISTYNRMRQGVNGLLRNMWVGPPSDSSQSILRKNESVEFSPNI